MCWKLKWFLITATKWLFLSLKWQGFWLFTKANKVTVITLERNRSDLQVCIEINWILAKWIAFLVNKTNYANEVSYPPKALVTSLFFGTWCSVAVPVKQEVLCKLWHLTKPTCRSPHCLDKLPLGHFAFSHALYEESVWMKSFTTWFSQMYFS